MAGDEQTQVARVARPSGRGLDGLEGSGGDHEVSPHSAGAASGPKRLARSMWPVRQVGHSSRDRPVSRPNIRTSS